MSGFLVRRAVLGDEAGIARVHVQGWHEAYTGRIPSSLLDRMDIARYTEGWRRSLAGERTAGEPAGRWWIAAQGDETIGFASSGPCRDQIGRAAGRERDVLSVLSSVVAASYKKKIKTKN